VRWFSQEEERRFINFWDNMQHVHAHNAQPSTSFKVLASFTLRHVVAGVSPLKTQE